MERFWLERPSTTRRREQVSLYKPCTLVKLSKVIKFRCNLLLSRNIL
uniref:Uncharacterized protein n=1 Tax=Utricularia reniformis TaxID=192314 RepID=A0A1Y0B0B4_9LAMI|nr:hypothetical protein AEK19_MT0573 [Utricularia reniformis]ART30829.1 hypothetical protein AEK19_MT0573 [Utricularia reniformis]